MAARIISVSGRNLLGSFISSFPHSLIYPILHFHAQIGGTSVACPHSSIAAPLPHSLSSWPSKDPVCKKPGATRISSSEMDAYGVAMRGRSAASISKAQFGPTPRKRERTARNGGGPGPRPQALLCLLLSLVVYAPLHHSTAHVAEGRPWQEGWRKAQRLLPAEEAVMATSSQDLSRASQDLAGEGMQGVQGKDGPLCCALSRGQQGNSLRATCHSRCHWACLTNVETRVPKHRSWAQSPTRSTWQGWDSDPGWPWSTHLLFLGDHATGNIQGLRPALQCLPQKWEYQFAAGALTPKPHGLDHRMTWR